MAYADYYRCNICNSRAFFDANLNYEPTDSEHHKLEYVGAMKVICDECAKSYSVVVVDSKGQIVKSENGTLVGKKENPL